MSASKNIHEDGAQAIQTLLKMIDGADGATHTLDFCTFVFAQDWLGDEIAQSLQRWAREGVQVKLLVDGVGAYLWVAIETLKISQMQEFT